MNKHKIDLLKSICTLEQEPLHDFLYDFLLDYYTEEDIIEIPGQFLYAIGTIPVGITAHLDTVHKIAPKEDQIFYDSDRAVMWSPMGIGGDDRCGVFIIMNLLFHGYKPHVLFTWNEEIGGLGAREAAVTINPDINFVLQFDRRGSGQSVYYNLENKEFEDYINSFGFKTEIGTYTDICELCPEWGVAGVNLSAGYISEHTDKELIFIDAVQYTLDRACEIIEDQIDSPKKYVYTEKSRMSYSSYYEDVYYTHNNYDKYTCHNCQKPDYWFAMNDQGICQTCENKRIFKELGL